MLIRQLNKVDVCQPRFACFMAILGRVLVFFIPIVVLKLDFMLDVPTHWPVTPVVYVLASLWIFCQVWLWIPLVMLGQSLVRSKRYLADVTQRFPLYAGIACALYEIIMPQFFPSPWAVSYVDAAPFLKPANQFSATIYTFTTFWLAHFLANGRRNNAAALLTLSVYLICLVVYSVIFPLDGPATRSDAVSVKLVNQDFQSADLSTQSDTEKAKSYALLEAKKQRLIDLTLNEPSTAVDLVILAEGAYPYSLHPSDMKMGNVFQDSVFSRAAQSMNSDILMGIYLADAEAGRVSGSNSALLIQRDGMLVGRYDKQNLIPFFEGFSNEFISQFVADLLNLKNLYTTGMQEKPLQTSIGTPFLVLICYEMYFSDIVRETVQRNPDAKFIVNMSKDLLIADSSAIDYITAQIRLRAIESQLPVLRSASFGPSGVFYPDGSFHVTKNSPDGISVEESIKIQAKGDSLFLKWGFIPLFMLFTILMLLDSGLNALLYRKPGEINSKLSPC